MKNKASSCMSRLLTFLGWAAGYFAFYSVLISIGEIIADMRPQFIRRIKGSHYLIGWLAATVLLIWLACKLGVKIAQWREKKHLDEVDAHAISNPDLMHLFQFSRFHVGGYWLLRMFLNHTARYHVEEMDDGENTRTLYQMELTPEYRHALFNDPEAPTWPNILVKIFRKMTPEQLEQPYTLASVLRCVRPQRTYTSPAGTRIFKRTRRTLYASAALLLCTFGLCFVALYVKAQLGSYYGKANENATTLAGLSMLFFIIGFPAYLSALRSRLHTLWANHVRSQLQASIPIPEETLVNEVGRETPPFSEEIRDYLLRSYCLYFDELTARSKAIETTTCMNILMQVVEALHIRELEEQKKAESDGGGCSSCSSCGGCSGCGGCGD